MTVTISPASVDVGRLGPVSVDELQRALTAVRAGEFRRRCLSTPRTRRADPRMGSDSSWQPGAGETILPVLGCAGSVGATTVAVAIATDHESHCRVVECVPFHRSGLSAASASELGVSPSGWAQGTRQQVLLERRTDTSPAVMEVPMPTPAEGTTLTVVDVGCDPWELDAGRGWLSQLVASASDVVLVARPTVPGLRRLESCLDLIGADRSLIVTVGPPRKRWGRGVGHSAGPLTRTLLKGGRLVEVPVDPGLAVSGLTPNPLPRPVVEAAASVIRLTKGPHS